MARTTTRHHAYEAAPQPIGQSFWLLATMAIAVIVVTAMGNSLAARPGSAPAPAFTGQELLELASPTPTERTASPTRAEAGASTPVDPAAPVLGVDEPSGDSSADAAGPSETNAVSDVAGSPTAGAAQPTPAGMTGGTEGLDYQARGEAALATISYPWQQLLPGWTVSFLPEQSGLYGLTKVPDKRIEIYVRDSQSLGLLAHVIAHELGHAVDVSLNDGPDRRRWEEARELGSSPWWPGSGATDFSTGAGDFAESFAAWQVGEQSFRSELSGAPTVEQIELLAELAAG